MAFALEVENLWYTYSDGTPALRGISLAFRAGAKVALLGANGAGKTTLIFHFNGLRRPQKGKVRVNGEEVNPRNLTWVRRQIGLVFQDPDDQVFSPTVAEDVAFGLVNLGVPAEEIPSRVQRALAAVDMEAYAGKVPFNLSYGQKKRVAIAGVLAMEPPIIVLDEPAAYLDPQAKKGLFQVLDHLNEQGKTIIVATHDVDLAAAWAEEVVILKAGEVLAQGTSGLLTQEALIQTAGLTLPLISQIFLQVPVFKDTETPRTVAAAVQQLREAFLLSQD